MFSEQQQRFLLIILILAILYMLCKPVLEGFYSYESNCVPELIYRNEISSIDRRPNFMLKDLRTNYWLIINSGRGKFVASRFGVPFSLSENPNEYLPLRTANDPNIYLLADYNGKGIRAISNPYNSTYKLEILIYEQRNIIAWEDDGGIQHYLYVEDSGYVNSTVNPDKASQFEMVMVE